MSRRPAALAIKACGSAQCPCEVKNLWTRAHLLITRWDEMQHHPNNLEIRRLVSDHMELLRAAAKVAEPVMEVRIEHSLRRPAFANPDMV
jgi:hypothetical protein